MRVLLDYRPALTNRTGVGEWVHELARAVGTLAGQGHSPASQLELTLFSSSFRDRLPASALAELPGAQAADCRVPVTLLNRAWYRHNWPPVEWLAGGRYDIVHSTAPLLLPARAPFRVLTIYDLDFLHHPDRAWAEMRTVFPSRVRTDAPAADLVVTISDWSARQIVNELGVEPERIAVCKPGVPGWIPAAPPERPDPGPAGYILFLGTLEPRKNVGGLLDAYERLMARWPGAPRLVLGGGHSGASGEWLARAARAPLAGRVDVRGFIPSADRVPTYAGAAVVVLPSWDEGFGLPALEAMALGVPVVVSNRGALPEVVGAAGLQADPADPDAIADALQRVLTQPSLWQTLRAAGLERARQFNWASAARTLVDRYQLLLQGTSRSGTPAGRAS